MKRFGLALLVGLPVLVPIPGFAGDGNTHEHGRVEFTVACNDAAQHRFRAGLALLHHMMYEQAADEFAAVSAADAGCAMAHWGIAMSIIHPLWGERPADAALERGEAALAAAAGLESTAREAAYLDAAAAFFRDWKTTDYPSQLAAFETGFRKLHDTYPDDIEAAAFYALAHLATAPKADRTLSHQKAAGALLEELHARAPEHPGLFHYIIHAYDNPALADRAVAVARGYDRIAPDVPHALHMPSHIFVRQGLWADVVDWNERSAAAALRHPVGGATSMHYAHALDYLVYAHLQRGQHEHARMVGNKMKGVADIQPTLAAAYAVAAVPARYLLEREQWAAAAALPEHPHAALPWEKFPGADAITWFARGIGAARSSDAARARAAVRALDALHARMVQTGETYWAVLADAQRKSVAAWLALSGKDTTQALALMTEAAELEDSVDKHPVTPGAVLPARELLGDMLMALDRPADALVAYEACLRVSANRFRSLHGAARAAELAGDRQRAQAYYTRIVELLDAADTELPVIAHARQFMSGDGP